MLNRSVMKQKMQDKGISQCALADAVGVAQPMIAQILVGRKQPSLGLAASIAKALGCTLDELVECETV